MQIDVGINRSRKFHAISCTYFFDKQPCYLEEETYVKLQFHQPRQYRHLAKQRYMVDVYNKYVL